MSDNTGSLLGMSIQGQAYFPPADANAARQHSKFLNEAIVHSGGIMIKKTRQPQNAEGMVAIATVAQQDELRSLAESTATLTLSYTDAGGNSFKGGGTINLEPMESEENRVGIIMISTTGWTSVIA